MLGESAVIAHNGTLMLQNNRRNAVHELIDMGCYTQINSYHVLKPKLFGEDISYEKELSILWNVVGFLQIASDMHNLDSRPPYMEQSA